MIKRIIPTYDQCREICNTFDNFTFYESKHVLDGYNVSMFNYRLAFYNDFEEHNAQELRGICFVFNTDGTLFNRHILLRKFYNLNQTQETLLSVVQEYKIRNIYNKEDGSIASFIKLPNGKVYGKSKMSFESDQAIAITNIYNTNADVRKLVDWTLDNNISAIFEYVSPSNRIVLRYNESKLILLQLRDNTTGEYLSLDKYKDQIGNVEIPTNESIYTLAELIERSKYVIDKEGDVIQFDNGLMMKIKTEWYFALHNLLTEEVTQENILIKYILNNEIDDVISKIPTDEIETLNKIQNINDIVVYSIKCRMEEVNKLYDIYKEIVNIKEFSIKYHKHKDFPFVMGIVNNNKLVYDLVVEEILKKTYRLMSAREWLGKYNI